MVSTPAITSADVDAAYDSSTEDLPSSDDWTQLFTSSWKPVSILGKNGWLVVSSASTSKYIFLPRSANYWSASFTGDKRDYVSLPAEGTVPTAVSTGELASAYVRPVKKGIEMEKNWFRIIARQAGTITRKGSNALQYSTDYGETWNSYSSPISVETGSVVCFRSTATSWNNSDGSILASSGNFEVAGDLSSLLVGVKFGTAEASVPTNFTFVNFFKGCTTLLDASELDFSSIKTLPNSSGYKSFFDGCTNLVAGPKEIPAATLGTQCYRNMFYGCTSLTSAPIIRNPTGRNGSGWYQRMFYNCSSLTEIVFLDEGTYQSNSFNSGDGSWVYGVGTGGTIYVADASNSPFAGVPTGPSAVPEGWTVATYSGE